MKIKKYDQDYVDYLRDESRLHGEADYVCFAENSDDIAAAIDFCRKEGIHLTIQGSRTGITGGCVPDGGLILNLEKMNKVLGLRQDADGNYFVRCQPGVKLIDLRKALSEMKEFLGKRKWFFPPDPTETTASIGGMAACNASGARSFRYGATRNWISDLRVIPQIQACDEIETNSRLDKDLKNAAGYYMRSDRRDFDLLIGSEGTLGVITELELKLLPEPLNYLSVMQFFKDENAAVDFCEQLRSKDILPDAVEYFDKAALDLLRKNRQLWPDLPELKDNWQQAVYYEYSGDDEEVLEEAAFKASDMAQEFGSCENDCWIVDNKADIEKMKLFRHAVPEAINMKLDVLKLLFPDIAKISTDLAVPDGFLKEMLSYYRQAKEDGWDVIVFGHIGNNHLHTNIIPHNYDQFLVAYELAKEWAKTAVESGGTISGEHGIGKSKTELLTIMYTKAELDKMKKIKQQFDPNGIFNPANIFSAD